MQNKFAPLFALVYGDAVVVGEGIVGGAWWENDTHRNLMMLTGGILG